MKVFANPNVTAGDSLVIGDGSVVNQEATLGDNVELGAHVTISMGASIGSHVVICDGTFIGQPGCHDWQPRPHRMQRGDQTRARRSTTSWRPRLDQFCIVSASATIGNMVEIGAGAEILDPALHPDIPDGTLIPSGPTAP